MFVYVCVCVCVLYCVYQTHTYMHIMIAPLHHTRTHCNHTHAHTQCLSSWTAWKEATSAAQQLSTLLKSSPGPFFRALSPRPFRAARLKSGALKGAKTESVLPSLPRCVRACVCARVRATKHACVTLRACVRVRCAAARPPFPLASCISAPLH